MFPPHGAEIIRNEAGEPLGWVQPAPAASYWCDDCGFSHGGECPPEFDPDDDEGEEMPEPEDYDPGPEVDDEGGMSEYHGFSSALEQEE